MTEMAAKTRQCSQDRCRPRYSLSEPLNNLANLCHTDFRSGGAGCWWLSPAFLWSCAQLIFSTSFRVRLNQVWPGPGFLVVTASRTEGRDAGLAGALGG